MMQGGRDQDPLLDVGGTFGFVGTDLTSPHAAAERDALPDLLISRSTMPLELRIHGVGGIQPAVMLEHPSVIQVGGDDTAGFFRRWCPEGGDSQLTIPWRLEGYSWGNLNARALTGPLWLLLTPFTVLNTASWCLPAPGQKATRSRDNVAQALLRLLGLALTLALVASLITAFADVIAWQAADQHALPSWAGSFMGLRPGIRIGLALVVVSLAIGVLTWASVWTTSHYEAWKAEERQQQADDEARAAGQVPELDPSWPLCSRWFWRGFEPVRRQCWLHTAGALALIGTISGLALPESSPVLRWTVSGVNLAILTLVAFFVVSPWADRAHVLSQQERDHALNPQARNNRRKAVTMRGVFGALAGVALVCALLGVVLDCVYAKAPQHALLPGEAWMWAVLAIVEISMIFLLFLLTLTWRGSNQHPAAANQHPAVAKFTMPLTAAFACIAGGVLSCGLVLTIAKLLSTSTVAFISSAQAPSGSQVLVPYIIYSYGVGAAAAFAVILVAVAPAVIFRLVRRAGKLKEVVSSIYPAGGDSAPPPGETEAGERTARAWATAEIVNRLWPILAPPISVGIVGIVVFDLLGIHLTKTSTVSDAVFWAGTVGAYLALALGAFVIAHTISRLRSGGADFSAVWDVGTFWPRACHPFAAPCYAERAVPEVADRVRRATAQPSQTVSPQLSDVPQASADKVLLNGYSQGSVIAAAVTAQLPPDVLADVAVVTMATPLRRLYGITWPRYFGTQYLKAMGQSLSCSAAGLGADDVRWRNIYRNTDHIGSWVLREKESAWQGCGSPSSSASSTGQQKAPNIDLTGVDTLILDPPVLPPRKSPYQQTFRFHRHSSYFPDPLVQDVADCLLKQIRWIP